MERRRKAGDPESKAQVVVAQALRAIQVIGGAGVPRHKRTASMILSAAAGPGWPNKNTGLRTAAPPECACRALLQKAGGKKSLGVFVSKGATHQFSFRESDLSVGSLDED